MSDRKPQYQCFAAILFLSFLLLAIVCLPRGVNAKIVGVVFDDSGSMKGKANMPALAMQILAASLDGETDQLYALRFSRFLKKNSRLPEPALLGPEYIGRMDRSAIEHLSLHSQNAVNHLLHTLSREWPRVGSSTPYSGVELMVDHLLKQGSESNPAVLLVFTDGAFNMTLKNKKKRLVPLPKQVRMNMKAYRDKYPHTPLTVYFIAFGEKERRIILNQEVAQALDQVFNGDRMAQIFPDVYQRGALMVKNFTQLRQTFIKVIAAIAGTDPRANESVVKKEKNRFILHPPFAISRLITIGMGPETATIPAPIPAIASTPNRKQSPITTQTLFHARMRQPDTHYRDPAAAQKWGAKIAHLQAQPALAAGQPLTLPFDGPLNDQVTLLFLSKIALDWEIVDENGVPVQPNANQEIALSAFSPYQVRARVLDYENQGQAIAANQLQQATFSLLRQQGPVPMTIDSNGQWAVTPLRYTQTGEETLEVGLHMPGFIAARAKQLRVKVAYRPLQLALKAEPPANCYACTAQQAELQIHPENGWQPAMNFTLTPTMAGKKVGQVQLQLSHPLGLDGFRLLDAAGKTLLTPEQDSHLLTIHNGQPHLLQLKVSPVFLKHFQGRSQNLRLQVTGLLPLRGQAAHAFTLIPRADKAELQVLADSHGQTPDKALRFYLPATTLCRTLPAPYQLNFAVRHHLPPFNLDNVQVKPDHTTNYPAYQLGQAERATKQHFSLALTPTAWLNCFVAAGPSRYQLSYAHPNQRVLKQTVEVIIEPVSWQERLTLCWQPLCYLLAGLWLLIALYQLLLSCRFPRHSRVEIREDGDDFKSQKVLRKGMGWYCYPFLWPFRRWHEKQRITRLQLQATAGGVILHFAKDQGDDLIRGITNQSLSAPLQLGAAQGHEVELNWGECLFEQGGERREFRLIEDARSQQWYG